MRLFHDHLLVKEPGTSQRTPWHQDQPYYNVEGMQTCSMWMPVDPVARESTLEFVAGLAPGAVADAADVHGQRGEVVPGGQPRGASRTSTPTRSAFRILGWELEPGDAVFFHMLTLHAAGGVSGGARRRAFSVRFLGDDVTHAPRPWRTSPEFPGLADELPAGAPMDHPLFPVRLGALSAAGRAN